MQTDINQIPLRPLIAKDFDSSKTFMDKFGLSVQENKMFLPTQHRFEIGQEIEIKFTLNHDKEIIHGSAKVIAIDQGLNGKPAGITIAFLELTARSQKNIAMIAQWQREANTP